MVASNENNGEGWMRYPIPPARSDSDTKSSEPTASTTPPGPLTTIVVKAGGGRGEPTRDGSPDDLITRHQIARAHVRLQLAAAERVVLVFRSDGQEQPARDQGDVVLGEDVGDRVDAVRRREQQRGGKA